MRSESARHVLTLVSGRIAAAAIGILGAPIIARLFEPADFGIVALLVTVATMLSQVLPLTYNNAIVIPREESQARALVRAAMYASLILAILIALLLMLLRIAGVPTPFSGQLGAWEWLVPLVALMLALSLVCEGWLTRTKGFAASAKAVFGQALLTSGGRISLGMAWGTSVWGLAVPYVAGVALRLGMLSRAAWLDRQPGMRPAAIRKVAFEYRDFPIFNLPAAFLRVLGVNLPILLLAPMFGPTAVGLYAMADRLIRVPVTMIADSVRRIYLQRASVILHKGGRLQPLYRRVTVYLVLMGLPPALLLLLVGEPLARILLGERWAQAGTFVEILAPLLLVMLTVQPAAALLALLRKQRLWLKLQLVSSLLRAVLMLAAWQAWRTEEGVLWGFVLGGALPYLWLMKYIYHLSGRPVESHGTST